MRILDTEKNVPDIYWLEYGTLVHYALDFDNMWTKIIPMKPYGQTQPKPEPDTQDQIKDEVQRHADAGALKLRIPFGGEGLKPILREAGQIVWAQWDTTHRQIAVSP